MGRFVVVMEHEEGSWRSLPKNAGLLRCGKSCRLRWINYLRADLKRGNISEEEEEMIIKLHATLGNSFSGPETVQFDSAKVLVLAGSSNDSIKLWNLEEAKGSTDRTVKFWYIKTFELIGSAGPEKHKK